MKTPIKISIVIFLACCAIAATFALGGCGYCQHKFEEVPKVAATCVEHGLRTAYKCVKCGKMFGYDVKKGSVYEISEQEQTDFGKHVAGSDFTPVVPEDADSFADIRIESDCTVCGENFETYGENVFAYTPADQRKYKHKSEDGIHYTEFSFPAGSADDTKIQIRYDDSGSDPFVAVSKITFKAQTPKKYVIMFKNESDIDVELVYGTEYYGVMCQTDVVTVPAGGYGASLLEVIHKDSNESYTELYLKTEIDREVKIGVCGFYFEETSKLQTSAVSYAQNEFYEGDTIDPEKIVIKQTYESGSVKHVPASGAVGEAIGRALTMGDKKVEFTFGGKKYKYDINVKTSKYTLTLVGATFSDGTTSRILDKHAEIPNDIVRKKDAIFLYWEDSFGNKYPNKFNMNGEDLTVRAVYADFDGNVLQKRSENYARGKACTSDDVGFSPISYGLGNLTDNNQDSVWGSDKYDNANNSVWVQVDLGEVKTISEVVLGERKNGEYFPQAYYIEVSEDGENYKRVFTTNNDVKSGNGETFFGNRTCFFAAVSARYVRVTASKLTCGSGNDGYYAQFAEMEVYNVEY